MMRFLLIAVLVCGALVSPALALQPIGELVPVEYVRTIDGDTIVVGILVSPTRLAINRLNLEIVAEADKQEQARARMDQIAEAGQEQADKLSHLDQSTDEAAAVWEVLHGLERDYNAARETYLGTIDVQIAKLRELEAPLEFAMTPEGMLEDLRAWDEAGFPPAGRNCTSGYSRSTRPN